MTACHAGPGGRQPGSLRLQAEVVHVGAQIGIYNPSGERVGRVSHLRNLEYVIVAGPKETVRCMVEPFSDHRVLSAS